MHCLTLLWLSKTMIRSTVQKLAASRISDSSKHKVRMHRDKEGRSLPT